jgi:hypothetical protein
LDSSVSNCKLPHGKEQCSSCDWWPSPGAGIYTASQLRVTNIALVFTAGWMWSNLICTHFHNLQLVPQGCKTPSRDIKCKGVAKLDCGNYPIWNKQHSVLGLEVLSIQAGQWSCNLCSCYLIFFVILSSWIVQICHVQYLII